ncbi:MAG: efflux RND transporter periplasmic adaptor subunit [Deltaproteobacteria bacterium]|nr:efflux RND transporter periplasmic adaptor subunit [Deltaproteobacteria bacterium]
MFVMATKNADLASLTIDRSSQGAHSPRKSRPARKLVVGSIVVLVLLAGIIFFGNVFNSGFEVQLATASLSSPSQANAVLTASGYVVARRKAAVASKGTGRLVFLGVEEGDQVKKGQTIARLEDADVVAARERARQNLRLAEADLHDAKTNYQRTRILLKQNAIAQAEYDVAEARFKRVVASIDVARFALQEAAVAVENTRIVAPFDGTVLKKNADVGEIVAPLAGAASSRAAVVTIADMSSLEVDADVSEANITRVAPEQQCEITLDAYPQQRYPGFVTKIVPTADRAKATVMVKIRFKEYDKRVLPEMSAKITFLRLGYELNAANSKPLLTVPAAAVASRGGRQVVYQVQQERAVEVPVSTGQTLAGLLEIKSGLNEGDKVVAKVDDQIQDGVKVILKGQ